MIHEKNRVKKYHDTVPLIKSRKKRSALKNIFVKKEKEYFFKYFPLFTEHVPNGLGIGSLAEI